MKAIIHKLRFVIFLLVPILFFGNKLKAQDDANCGIVIDGMLADSINCWNFKDFSIVFPITDKYQKYDDIELTLYVRFVNEGKIYEFRANGAFDKRAFVFDISKQNFTEWFSNAKLGIWKVFSDGHNANQFSGNAGCFPLNQWGWDPDMGISEQKQYATGMYIQCDITGYMLTGSDYNGPTYDGGTILYRTNQYPISIKRKQKDVPGLDPSNTCSITGKPLTLKMEAVNYRDDLFIVKKDASGTSSSTTGTTNNNTSTSSMSSNTSTIITTSAIKTQTQLKPLDKTKAGYFEEKDDHGKVSRAGYEKTGDGDPVYTGEVREYDSDGKVTSVTIYTDGIQNGLYLTYDENGKLEISGNYKNGNQDGVWQTYSNGVLSKTQKYSNGEEVK